jgi:prepilin-type N-terminal cleavage/methylation domain-containing protein
MENRRDAQSAALRFPLLFKSNKLLKTSEDTHKKDTKKRLPLADRRVVLDLIAQHHIGRGERFTYFSSKKSDGFTLIELLIVVAIIAILAAIAVPNFLEAQTRAKVARVKADQRTIATAIESYAVDWTVIPLGIGARPTGGGSVFMAYLTPYIPMTSPIAYMTSVPKDPFSSVQLFYASVAGGVPGEANVYFYTHVPKAGNPAQLRAFTRGYTWCLSTWGPSKTNSSPNAAILGYDPDDAGIVDPAAKNTWLRNNQGVNGVYDPTNGTISFGCVARTNKGVFESAR